MSFFFFVTGFLLGRQFGPVIIIWSFNNTNLHKYDKVADPYLEYVLLGIPFIQMPNNADWPIVEGTAQEKRPVHALPFRVGWDLSYPYPYR